jgi:DNA-binding transcriptional ArsR family regulator
MVSEETLTVVLQFFRALADASRLRLLGILAESECSVDELATRLGLTAPTVSHHLGKLKGLGLVRMRPQGTTHLYSLDEEALRRLSKDILSPERMRSLADDAQGTAWERKVLRDFFEGERLKEIPAVRKKREIVLRWLANRFDPGVRYSEKEVNEVLKRHHPDTATLRRELVAERAGLLRRERGVYWRAEGP